MSRRSLRRRAAVVAVGGALMVVLALPPVPGTAGCLAPADVAVDVSGTIGPFWGNDDGDLLYARGIGTGQDLVRRGLGEFEDELFSAGDGVPSSDQVWTAFHGGAMNSRGDAAFVASTTIEDDPGTTEDESLEPARRAAWALRGNTLFPIGRLGGPSPIPNPFGGQVPWGTFFDAAPDGRPDAGPISIVFSAQVGAPDGRQGVFRWDETSGAVTPLVLTGEPSPAGGPYTTFGRLRVNEAGDVLFYALTQVSQSSPIAPGLFRIDRFGQTARIVKFGVEGDLVPGIGRFSLIQDFDVDGAGDVVFASAVEDGPAAPSGVFRWTGGTITVVAAEGGPTPVGGSYGSFMQAQTRCDEPGNLVFMVPLSSDVGGTGLFAASAGSASILPLGATRDPLTIASLGGGRIAYQTPADTRTVVPSDGSDEGPTDFRVARVDLRNSTRVGGDSVALDLRFRLPSWDAQDPAVFAASADRSSPTRQFAAGDLAKIVEARVQIAPNGVNLVFGAGGTESAPKGTVTLNDAPGTVSRLSFSKAKDVATWRFRAGVGSGTFTLNLTAGTAKLTFTGASLTPNTDPNQFPVALTLRTDGDVGAARTGAAAYFHRSVRLDADQPNFGTGRRVVSRGERIPGGTLYVDVLRVSRKLKVQKGQSAPQVASDKIVCSGTLRLCPGATPPSTPTLAASVAFGNVAVADLPLRRVGRSGSRYAGRAESGGATFSLTFDAVRGTFAVSAVSPTPIAALADADFSGAGGPNDAKRTVGGMTLPVAIRIERAYEADFDVAMTRLPGGRAFTR